MRRLPKTALAAAVLLTTLLLGGCVNFQITCGVDAANRAVLRYDGTVEPAPLRAQDREPAAQTLSTLLEHFRDQGFSVSGGPGEGDTWTFSAVRVQSCATLEEAVETLRGWITDDSFSPFDSAGLLWNTTDYEDAGYLKVTLDLTSVLDGDAGGYPHDIAALYTEGLETAQGSLTLMLPGDELLEADGDATLGGGVITCTLPLSLREPVTASLMTGLERSGQERDDRLWEAEERSSLAHSRVAPAAALLAVLAAVTAALGVLARRRNRAA